MQAACSSVATFASSFDQPSSALPVGRRGGVRYAAKTVSSWPLAPPVADASSSACGRLVSDCLGFARQFLACGRRRAGRGRQLASRFRLHELDGIGSKSTSVAQTTSLAAKRRGSQTREKPNHRADHAAPSKWMDRFNRGQKFGGLWRRTTRNRDDSRRLPRSGRSNCRRYRRSVGLTRVRGRGRRSGAGRSATDGSPTRRCLARAQG